MPRGGKRKGAGRKPRAEAVADKQIAIRLTPHEHALLAAFAVRVGLTIGELVRRISLTWVAEYRWPDKD